MSEPHAPDTAPDLGKLAQDWITLWQSELAALAADREAQETWRTWLAIWAGVAASAMKALPRHDGLHAGGGGAADAPRAAPAAAASDPRDAVIDRLARHAGELARRVAELERRLDGMEPGRG